MKTLSIKSIIANQNQLLLNKLIAKIIQIFKTIKMNKKMLNYLKTKLLKNQKVL